MADDQKSPSTDRRSFIKEIVGGAFTLIGTIFAIRHDRREQEKHDWARADRQQGQIVEVRGTIEGHSSVQANLSVAHETDSALPITPVRKSSSDHVTIPI